MKAIRTCAALAVLVLLAACGDAPPTPAKTLLDLAWDRSAQKLPMLAYADRNLPDLEARYAGLAADSGAQGAVIAYDYARALSVLQEHKRALAAFERALELQPEATWIWNDVGVELAWLGRDVEAKEAFARGIVHTPVNRSANSAPTGYFLATANYEQVLTVVGVSPKPALMEPGLSDYVSLRGALASKALGRDVEAFLVERGWIAPASNEWPAPLFELVRGRVGEAELAAWLARDADPVDPEKLCEALYYVGVDHEIAGRHDLARKYYDAVRRTGVVYFIEFDGAGRALRRLKG